MTLYFTQEATFWHEVKYWISRRTSVPTTLFHLIRARDGAKMPWDSTIGDEQDWATIVVVVKEW